MTLATHLAGVAEKTEEFARRCNLSDDFIHDLALAARLHDLGKADARFQALLHGGDRIQALLALQAGKPLAKSNLLPRDRDGFVAARDRSGFPRSGRHELISAGLIRQNPGLLNGATASGPHDPDLVLHLVGTHHGYARPFAPVIRDNADVSIKLEDPPLIGSNRHGLDALGSGWTDQFWLLVQRYGYWVFVTLNRFFALLTTVSLRRNKNREQYPTSRTQGR